MAELDQTDISSYMIYHIDGLECVCGKDIESSQSHNCILPSLKLDIRKCEQSCPRCDKEAHLRWFHQLWEYDEDGYAHCRDCGARCLGGQLPMRCDCDLDMEYLPLENDRGVQCQLCPKWCQNQCMVACRHCLNPLTYCNSCDFCAYMEQWLWIDDQCYCSQCKTDLIYGDRCSNDCIDNDLSLLATASGWHSSPHTCKKCSTPITFGEDYCNPCDSRL